MVFRTLNGRERNLSITPYLIDWDRRVSGPQKRVKDFLKPYWGRDTVLEEAAIVGNRMRLDLVNVNKLIVVEVSPSQHSSYNKFFHGSMEGFKSSLRRDLKKANWCALNGFVYCELVDEDLKEGLSEQLFKDRFDVIL